jgi:hypothetical protein
MSGAAASTCSRDCPEGDHIAPARLALALLLERALGLAQPTPSTSAGAQCSGSSSPLASP